MEIHIEKDDSFKIQIENSSVDNLSELESEYLKAYLEKDPNYIENQWSFKQKKFDLDDVDAEDFINSPSAMKELKKYRESKLNRDNLQDKNLLHALFDLISLKNLRKGVDTENMQRVHNAIQEAKKLRHTVWQNEQLADFAKEKISAEVKARGLNDKESLKDALSATGPGTLHDTTLQLDAAVKEAVMANDSLQDFMEINSEVPESIISKSPSESMQELSDMVKELSESMMKSMSEIVDSLCSMFSGGTNSPKRAM
ncbi:hypothetical protein OCF84_20690 (plasmid) [Shewanella xiamenensis]|uniref:Uncharacterized protein n=1 Tax=Shewanella xiamenensis TaxID=332186 RepID=A0ABT6UGZ5_9GAMM|nr:hypothetical protein [Shewanella xiamenensis]MDI5833313.1 hypothetical protein [Shewanella xiamenensis]WHF57936.1 hypothetical protein OCF84_20690 [Shewanella xiamenensis]